MTDKQRIPIFFAANVGYYQHLCVTLCSLLENNKSREFDIYVLTDDAESKENEKIIKLKNAYKNFNIYFKQIDDSILVDFPLPTNIDYISQQMYYRYLIPDLFPELDKGIYLDCDTICHGNINEMWETNINEYYIAGVEDKYVIVINYKPIIGFTMNDYYINSGVLLMNLSKMKADNIGELLFENTKRLKLLTRFPDQDVINYTLKGKIKELDSRFNWATNNSVESKQNSLSHQPAVISHFTGRAKPWAPQYKCSHESANHYFYYLSKTPYRNFIYRYRIEHFFRYSIKAFIKTIVKKLLPANFIKFVRLYHQHIFVSGK
jgi:lipopolysaccharide biosynthesis glycosyltransferase